MTYPAEIIRQQIYDEFNYFFNSQYYTIGPKITR